MATNTLPKLKEYKLHTISFVRPEEGVDYHWCYKNSTSFHKHDWYEFIIVTEGKMRHWHNGKTTVLSKGMFFLVKPGEYHQFLPYHNRHAKQINFAITPQAIDRLYSPILKEDFVAKLNDWEFPTSLQLPQEILDNTFNSVNRINQFSPTSTGIYSTIKLIILELLVYLMEKIEAEEALTATQEPPEWLVEFLELLKNPNVFTLKLKDIYPLAPYSQYTDASTLDISSKLAYDSLSHFNRIFKKITGKTPIEYKKTIDN